MTMVCAFPCPRCGSSDIRRSHRHGLGELPQMLVGIYPFRCVGCGERFFGNIWRLAVRGHTTCPRCLRLDVLPWIKPEDRVSGWDRLLMGLGARAYRCNPCRYIFFSFKRPVR